MKYMDIFSDAISHFTDIPEEFVRGYLESFVLENGKKGELLEYIMQIDFPEAEAVILLNDLKEGDLQSTISFFNSSVRIISEEEQKLALVN